MVWAVVVSSSLVSVETAAYELYDVTILETNFPLENTTSRDSSVGIANRVWAGRPRSQGWIPCRDKRFLSSS
jgi:hypothetical protein